MHISTSFSKSDKELQNSYHCSISLPLHFALLSLIRPARLTIQIYSAEGEEIGEIQMFLTKNDLHFILPKGTLSWLLLFFPNLPFPGRM